MIVIVIVAVLLIGGIAAFVVISKGKNTGGQAPAAATPAARPAPAPAPAPAAEPKSATSPAPAEAAAPKKTVKKVVKKPAAAVEPPAPAAQPQMAAPATAPAPEPPEILLADLDGDEDEDDGVTLSRFGGPPAKPKPVAGEPKVEPAKPRYMMEAPLDDLKAQIAEPAPRPEPVAVVEELPVEPAPEPEPEPVLEAPAFDPTLTVVAPLSASAVAEMNEDDDKAPSEDAADETPVVATADVPDLQLAPEPETIIDLDATDDDTPLSEIVADLIDAADPEVAEVMAKLIDASDPELVAELVGSNELEVAEVVARLVDAADPDVRSLVAELADAPDRRQVAEVLRLVDAAYTGVSGESPVGELSPEIAQKLEELDLEADLDLTSRPGEMAQFARLENRDQLRVIIRVLVGLVAREDLPQSPRMPADPASSAEQRRWPLSRARWPVPPPDGEVVVKRDPLPGRRTSTKAS